MTGWTTGRDEPGYYGEPLVKAAPWKKEIAAYFFTGGLAGASSVLAAAARVLGQPRLASHARRWALVGLAPSPVLLVADLGRPSRFANMLRVMKPTSPMSVGSWLLAAYSPVAAGAALCTGRSRSSRTGLALDVTAALLGSVLTTYTAVLVSDTATPVWHESRRLLPVLFAASAAASAGGAAAITAGGPDGGPARLLGAGAALTEAVIARAIERELGPLAAARQGGRAGAYRRAAEVLSCGGAVLLAAGRRRPVVVAGAVAVVSGALAQRLCVFESGLASAQDPAHTLFAQRGPDGPV